jgi:hypothetical protein
MRGGICVALYRGRNALQLDVDGNEASRDRLQSSSLAFDQLANRLGPDLASFQGKQDIHLLK